MAVAVGEEWGVTAAEKLELAIKAVRAGMKREGAERRLYLGEWHSVDPPELNDECRSCLARGGRIVVCAESARAVEVWCREHRLNRQQVIYARHPRDVLGDRPVVRLPGWDRHPQAAEISAILRNVDEARR